MLYVVVANVSDLQLLKAQYLLSNNDFTVDVASKRANTFHSSRALVKFAFEHFYNLPMPKIQINDNGKPYFLDPNYYFNISHSLSSIAIILGHYECAIDIEKINTNKNLDTLVNKILSPCEKEYFYSLNELERMIYFSKAWSIRECLLKLSGIGIKDLGQIQVDSLNCIFYQKAKSGYIHSINLKNTTSDKLDMNLSFFSTDKSFKFFTFKNNELTAMQQDKFKIELTYVNK